MTTMAADTAGLGSLAALIQHAALTAESPSISAEALSDKQVSAYIRSLSNLSLSDLKTQPQQLQSKSEALHQQLSELCISQTDAFIDIHHAEQQFGPSLTTFATHLDDLITHTLPDLQAAADAFLAGSQPVLDERKRVQNVADQYERGHLSDLLEIPPLVHTCVRAGHYSEAIQLAEHLVDLLKPADAEAAISNDSYASAASGQRSTYLSLLIETLSHLATMKADLISSFSKSGLKLPAAFKSVSILRRLSHFESQLPALSDWHRVQTSDVLVPQLAMSENQLCLAFLKARIGSFHAALDAMGSPSSSSSEAYLRRYIDLWRDELADTLGMAFPLFIDDAPSRSRSKDDQASAQHMVTPSYLVSAFTTSGLQRLRDTVSVQLVASALRVQSSSSASPSATLETLAETFANIHTQLSYACASLARFGLDFGALLFAPSAKIAADPDESTQSLSTFEAAWLDVLTFSLDQAFAHTNLQLDKHLQAQHASLPSRWLISSQLPAAALEDLYRVDAATSLDPSTYDDYSRPNIELVDYPLIAKLLNRLLEWIHALQVFAPATLSSALLHRLDKHFASLTQRLLTQVPEAISKIDAISAQADRLLVDDEAQSFLQHLDEDDEASRTLQVQLIKDRESVIFGKVIAMWHSSVVSWTLNVVRSHIFDMASDDKGVAGSRAADAEWIKAQQWISTTRSRVSDSNKQRHQAANARKKAVEEAEAKVKAEAELQARREAEEKARLEAEEQARLKAEDEARIKAEEEARLKAEEDARKAAEARLKAEEEARLKAEKEARLKAEEEARLKAEEEERKMEENARRKAEEARRKADEEARIKAEEAAQFKVVEEARIKAEEEEKLNAEAKARAMAAEEEAKVKAEAEAEAVAKAQAEAEAKEKARLQADQEARLKAEQEAKLKAEEEATLKAEAEAKAKAEQEAKEKEREDAEAAQAKAKARAEQEARAKADDEGEAQVHSLDTEAKVDVEPSTKAESTTEDANHVSPEPTATPAAALKKLSLADKLRQRKEQRDRAAALGATAAFFQKSTEASATTTDSSDLQPVAEADSALVHPTKSDDSEEVDPNDSSEVTNALERHDTTGLSVAQPGTVEVVEEKAEKEEAATDGDNDDEDQMEAEPGEDDGSGVNRPATPATPNADGASGGTRSKKNKKKNKKK